MKLSGHRLALSASYPSPERDRKFLQRPDANRRIAEAIVPLVNLLVANGADIVFGGHPSVTRLLAGIVANFDGRAPRLAEPSGPAPSNENLPRFGRVVLYQAAAFTAIDEVDWLRHHPLVDVVSVPVAQEEVQLGSDRDPQRYPKTLSTLRTRMLTDAPVNALICVGGMEGVISEAHQFAERFPRRPIFTYATTGGASQLLADEHNGRNFITPDVEIPSLARPSSHEQVEKIWAFTEEELCELGTYTAAAYRVVRDLQELGSR